MPTVLIVDDKEDWRALLRAVLEDDGLSVIAEAADASEAVRLAGDRQPDAIVLDAVMPGTSGIAALARIKDAAPEATVVVVSGFGDDERERALELGAVAFLEKSELDQLGDVLLKGWRAKHS